MLNGRDLCLVGCRLGLLSGWIAVCSRLTRLADGLVGWPTLQPACHFLYACFTSCGAMHCCPCLNPAIFWLPLGGISFNQDPTLVHSYGRCRFQHVATGDCISKTPSDLGDTFQQYRASGPTGGCLCVPSAEGRGGPKLPRML